jgi:hypothetical protein
LDLEAEIWTVISKWVILPALYSYFWIRDQGITLLYTIMELGGILSSNLQLFMTSQKFKILLITSRSAEPNLQVHYLPIWSKILFSKLILLSQQKISNKFVTIYYIILRGHWQSVEKQLRYSNLLFNVW